jgi:hypothetical protein
MSIRKLEKLNPRLAAEVEKLTKEIVEPIPPDKCEYPEVWYGCRETVRESGEVVTNSNVQKCYKDKIENVVVRKQASLLGNTVLPILGGLKDKGMDVSDKAKVIEALNGMLSIGGVPKVIEYLNLLNDESYGMLIEQYLD